MLPRLNDMQSHERSHEKLLCNHRDVNKGKKQALSRAGESGSPMGYYFFIGPIRPETKESERDPSLRITFLFYSWD